MKHLPIQNLHVFNYTGCLFVFSSTPIMMRQNLATVSPPPGYETSLMHFIFIHRCFIQERCSTGPTYLICYVSRSVYTHASLHDSALQRSVWTFHLMCLGPKGQQWSLCRGVICFRSWGTPSLTAVWGSTKRRGGRWRTCWVSNSDSGACTCSTHSSVSKINS